MKGANLTHPPNRNIYPICQHTPEEYLLEPGQPQPKVTRFLTGRGAAGSPRRVTPSLLTSGKTPTGCSWVRVQIRGSAVGFCTLSCNLPCPALLSSTTSRMSAG